MDFYTTIDKPAGPILLKEKKSKFFGFAFPVTNEEEIKELLQNLKKEYSTANHCCYAWQLGAENITYRANDDGEPNNTAGLPIYGQIQSLDLTNILVVVVRMYGGTKLGVGGLISAYKETSKMVLEISEKKHVIIEEELEIIFDYPEMDLVMRTIKKYNLKINGQALHLQCKMQLLIPKKDFKKVKKLFKSFHKIVIKD